MCNLCNSQQNKTQKLTKAQKWGRKSGTCQKTVSDGNIVLCTVHCVAVLSLSTITNTSYNNLKSAKIVLKTKNATFYILNSGIDVVLFT